MILDSGFCVLQALIELRKSGVFTGALIKKQQFWPKYVPGDMIDDHFKDKDVGSVDSLKGKIDNVPYDIYCMKEPDYVIKIMSTYGGLFEKDGQKTSERKFKVGGEDNVVTFKYKIPFSNHFDYRHIVDDHNGIRHMKPSLEQVWTTHRWPVRVFSFLLAVSEVNTYLAFKYFVWNSNEKMDFMTFRSKLAWSMINNMYLMDEESPDTRGRKKRRQNEHKWETALPHAKFFFGINGISPVLKDSSNIDVA